MKISRVKVVRIVLGMAWLLVMCVGWVNNHSSAQSAVDKISEEDFYRAVDKLWEDHITWTRLYIVSAAANLEDKDVVAERLIQNQNDIGTVIKGFYGYDAGTKLTDLLKDHIHDTIAVLDAIKGGDNTQIDDAKQKWYANAEDIAAFLSSINSKEWPLNMLKKQMKTYLDLTLKEAVDRLGGKYADDVKDYDKVHDHILDFADVMGEGIINQFPDRFAGDSGQ